MDNNVSVVAESNGPSNFIKVFQYDTAQCAEECVVAIAQGERLTFHGSVTVKPLFGSVICFGWRETTRIGDDSRLRVCAPLGAGAAASIVPQKRKLFQQGVDRFREVLLKLALPTPVTEELVNFATDCTAAEKCWSVFSLRPDVPPWLHAVCRVFGNGYLLPPTFNFGADSSSEQSESCSEQQRLCSTAVGVSPRRGTFLSRELSACFDAIHSDALDAARTRSTLVVAVLGGKNSGKSTACRALTNFLLSRRDSARLACNLKLHWLDCDVGQSEFTPGCSVSFCGNLTKPMLDPPAANMRVQLTAKQMDQNNSSCTENDLCTFFYGWNSPSVDTERYLGCVRDAFQLGSRDHCASSHGNVLVVNLCGWMIGEGAELTMNVLRCIKATHVIELLGDIPYFIESPPSVVKRWKVTGKRNVKPPEGALDGRALREAAMISYLSALCPALWWPAEVPSNCVAMAANLRVCALCAHRVPTQSLRHYNDDATLPVVLPAASALMCVGFGLVRAVCPAKKRFYVITPLSGDLLASVNAMAFGQFTVPEGVLALQPSVDRAPYMRRISSERASGQRLFDMLSAPLAHAKQGARMADRIRRSALKKTRVASASPRKGWAALGKVPKLARRQSSGFVKGKKLKRLARGQLRKPIKLLP